MKRPFKIKARKGRSQQDLWKALREAEKQAAPVEVVKPKA